MTAAEAAAAAHHHGIVRLQTKDSVTMDTKSMKSQLKALATKQTYDVTQYYRTTGFPQWIARHPRFEHVTLSVIALNALWIWIDTDLNPGDMLLQSPPIFQIAEYAFCMYFTYEWTVRFLAFERKANCLRDGWFVFDSLLVATMVLETWILTTFFLALFIVSGDTGGDLSDASILRVARLLRLSRMARMARLLRALPELLILIKGMVAALRSVCFALGLLLSILYVFGIAFTQLCEGTSLEPRFSTVMTSMHTLLVYGALMDEVSFLIELIQEESVFLLIFFYCFILLAALTVMNMLIGVICEMVLNVGERERECSTVVYVTEKLQQLMDTCGVDENDDMLISKQEFLNMLTNNRKATTILRDVGVDVVGLVDVVDTIFTLDAEDEEENLDENHEKQLTFDEFVKVVLDLRGTKTSRVKDVMNLRKHINGHFARLEQRLCDSGLLQKGSFYNGSTSNKDDTPLNSARDEPVKFPVCVSAAAIQPAAAHEREIAFLRAENLRLKEQLTHLEDHISSRHSIEGMLERPAKPPFSNSSKSDLVQRCLKDVMSRSGLASEALNGASAPGLDRCSSSVISGTDSIERSFPRRPTHPVTATGAALSNPLDTSSTGPAPHFPSLKAAEPLRGQGISFGPSDVPP